MTVIKNQVVNAGGNPIMLQNLGANIPAAGVVGRLYVATDTLLIYRDNGTIWQVVSGGGASLSLQQVTDIGNITTNEILVGNVDAPNVARLAGVGVGSVGLFAGDDGGNNSEYRSDGCYVAGNVTTAGFFGTISGTGIDAMMANGTFKKLASGTYAPMLTPSSNCAAVALVYANYLRVGNVVTVSILMNVTPTLGGFNTGVQAITLPVSFSTYNRYQARGVVYDTITQNVVAVSGFNSGSSSTTIFFTPVANNVQSVSIEIIYSGTP